MSEKIKYVCDVPCPACGCVIIIKKQTKIIAPAEKAEKEESYFAEKGVQTKTNHGESLTRLLKTFF